MDPRDRMGRGTAEFGVGARREDLLWSKSVEDQSVIREFSERLTDHAALPGGNNFDINFRSRNAPRFNVFNQYEQDSNTLEAVRKRLSAAMLDRSDFVGTEAELYGLDGLLDALKYYPRTRATMVTQDMLDKEALKRRLMEN
ncbi:uncharacterized protein BXIN_2561 [Babesia sp. Xinjiang]|uniref:uncharacterized protein n=1 Tax=Babesia sp. Xinjiang TaxID=462227 RepID=UPI000A23457C|nr:uncharacterized protein BXIN_2561 [Babesia sp. Xinjiang]ORM41452.1 hypothetical protein BXIN_2561 [Babesia sp. Xinjiang]